MRLINPHSQFVAQDIRFAVAAGDNDVGAKFISPARARPPLPLITVGVTTIGDARAAFSNFGSIVDLFVPGANLISAWTVDRQHYRE